MELEGKKFGRGPRELSGAVDLISRYKLMPFHEFFCKKPLPVSVADTHYLHNIVGDTEIRKGDGMLLGQLVQTPSSNRDGKVRILPIELQALGEAFHLRETARVELPPGEKGAPTIAEKSKNEFKDNDMKHKKHRDKEKRKDKEHKKSKRQHKDHNIDKENKNHKSAHQESGADYIKKHNEKRKKHDSNQDAINMHKHKRSKHKSSPKDELGRIKVLG